MRRHLAAALVFALPALAPACRREGRPTVKADPAASTSASASSPNAALLAWLDAAQVDDRRFARTTLYTWTTVDQIDELQKDETLLTRAMKLAGTTEYELDLRSSKDPFAPELLRDEYQRVRFAWTAGWPTVLGLAGIGYGNHLLAIRLKPEAIFARVTATDPIRFLDASQHVVAEADVRAHPERLAAVLHVRMGKPEDPRRYREYVIVNESMIEEWSYGTPELSRLVEADLRNVVALGPLLGDTHALDLPTIWASGAKKDDLDERYLGAIAFENEAYEAKTLALDDLRTSLAPPADARPPMRHRPTVTWPPPPVPKPPLVGPLKPGKPPPW